MDCGPPGSLAVRFPRQEYWSGLHTLLQEILPTQESNLSLLHFRGILYQLSHQGSPRLLEWVAHAAYLQGLFPTQESNQRIFINRPKVSSTWIFSSYNTVEKVSQYWGKYSF